jgi:cytidylate kinase
MSLDSIIESLVSRQLKAQVKLEPPPQLKGTVVTVGRSCGSGGEKIAQMLAQRLGLHCYDNDLLDAIAEEARTDARIMSLLDEHTQQLMDGWLRSIITGRSAFSTEYRRALVSVVLGISQAGGVIVGRGAHLILSGRNVFRMRVVCSLAACVERVASEKGFRRGKAEKFVLKTDKRRIKFLRQIYPRNVHASSSYDLTVNTDRISFAQAVEIALFTMKQLGYEVPEPRLVVEEAAASG